MKTKTLLSTLLTSSIAFYASGIFAQCTAGFTYTINGGTVNFTSTSTGAIQPYYAWNFGDGNSDTLTNTSHTYYNGTYPVSLHYTDTLNASCDTWAYDTIVISNGTNAPCNAYFYALADTAQAQPIGTVWFSDQSSYQPKQWFWDFGDGNTSSVGANLIHTYSVNGTYSVCLTITNISGVTCSFCDTVNSVPCIFQLTDSFDHAMNVNTASFISYCSGASNPSYYWDFGDGNYSSLQNPIHTYPYNGIFNVCLYFTDIGKCSKTFCDTIIITNAVPYPCDALFAYYNDTSVNGNVVFGDQSSSNIINWSWQFPGGTPSTSSAQNPGYLFYPPGTYTASLTVTNLSGISCSYSNTIYVGTNCVDTGAYFTIQPDTIPQVWIVNNMSSGVQPISYSWSWGDGSPNSTGPTPSHTYSQAGWYSICLTITDANGCGSSFCSNDSLYKFNTNSTMISVYVISAVTGIEENSLATNDVSIYPNPSGGTFTLLFESGTTATLNVMNVLGEVIYSEQIKNALRKQVDLNNISNGIYFIQLKTKETSLTKKLVIDK